jgi:DNA (cytosine-5)-methyltransferase 1
MSPLTTDAIESGFLLPTPKCADATMGAILNDNTKLIMLKSGKLRKISNQGVSGSIGLARTIMMWATPTCHMAKEAAYPAEFRRNTPSLTAEANIGTPAKNWPTPCASDNRDRGNIGSPAILRRKEKGKQIMLSQSVSDISGALNPPWVEWLMGWPLEWTDLKPLAMDKFLLWLNSHGKY